MDASQKKIIAVAVVAILVITAVGTGWALTRNNGGSKTASVAEALEVYGNANNDAVLDEQDATLIQSIVDKQTAWQTAYPFADANHDGSVTTADVDYVHAILKATVGHQVTVYHNAQSPSGKYVTDTKYPITAALSSCDQTMIIMLKTLGINSQIKATSYYYEDHANYDKYIFGDYFDRMTTAYRIGNNNTAVNVDTASQFVTSAGCTAYVYTSANATMKNTAAVEDAHIDCVQLGVDQSTIGDFVSAALILGFLFGTADNQVQQTSVRLAQWMDSYAADLQSHLQPLADGKVARISAAVSSMSTYVSVKSSANTNILLEAGLTSALADADSPAGKTTRTYVGGTDTWLNAENVDLMVIVKGSTGGWSWFDKNYQQADLPAAFASHLQNYSTLKCCQDGHAVIVSTMMPAPLKSGAMSEAAYGTALYPAGWIAGHLADFYETFWGWSAEQCSGQQYYLTQAQVLGS